MELPGVSAYLGEAAVAVGLSSALIVDALLPGGDLTPWPTGRAKFSPPNVRADP